MATIAPGNAEQARRWNEENADVWVEQQPRIDALLAPLGARVLEAAKAAPGERVLDVGCGAGTTTLALARSVGARGRVVGLDVSAPMLALARERAREAGVADRIDFIEADAQQQDLAPARFDLLFSRFGVMFFADPVAAFRNLARALVPGGRLAFLCWQAIPRNPWVALPLAALADVLPAQPPLPPDEPGPFAFADRARVTGILEAAGFRDVAAQSLEADLALAADLDGAVAMALDVGPPARAVRLAGEAVRRAAEPVLRELFARHLGPRGVTLGSATWLFTGTRSA
jgi:SAM-dependent methyltransferase